MGSQGSSPLLTPPRVNRVRTPPIGLSELAGEVASPPKPGKGELSQTSSDRYKSDPPLALLVRVTETDGSALPLDMWTVPMVENAIETLTTHTPAKLSLVTPKEAIVYLPEGVVCTLAAMKLHGADNWYGRQCVITVMVAPESTLREIIGIREVTAREDQRVEYRLKNVMLDRDQEIGTFIQEFKSQVDRLSEMAGRVEKLEASFKKISEREVEAAKWQTFPTPSKEKFSSNRPFEGYIPIDSQIPWAKQLRFSTFSGIEPVPKNEVDYEQWTFEVNDALARYPAQQIREAVLKSLRADAATVIRHQGVGCSLGTIIQRLDMSFAPETEVDVLLQDYYQLKQGVDEKAQAFAVRLEAALEKIRTHYPESYPAKHSAPSLKDRLFHGLQKPIRDSIRYKYEDREIDFPRLLAAARKAEGEEPSAEGKAFKVRAKAAAVAAPTPEDTLTTEIQNLVQTMKQMQSRPSRGGRGRGGRGPTRSSQEEMGRRDEPLRDREPMAPRIDPSTKDWRRRIRCFRCGGWGHDSRECPSRLNARGGGRGSEPSPQPQAGRAGPEGPPGGGIPPVPVRSGVDSSAPGCAQETSQQSPLIEIISRKLQRDQQCYNPDPLVNLIGRTSETNIRVEGKLVKGLVDTGSQISSITLALAMELGLVVSPLERVLNIEGSGGCEVPYLGITEGKVELEEVKGFEQEVVFLVVPDSPYGKICPIQLGTKIIDAVLDFLTVNQGVQGSLASLQAWKRAQLSTMLLSKSTRVQGDYELPLNVTAKVCQHVTLRPFQTKTVEVITSARGHKRDINVWVESLDKPIHTDISLIPSYTTLQAGSPRVQLLLRNGSSRDQVLRNGTIVARVGAGNRVSSDPSIMKSTRAVKQELGQDRLGKLFAKLNLEGLQEWTEDCQVKAKGLLENFGDIFALGDLELGKTNLVKHRIVLKDEVPFKEKYRRIPYNQYDEVRKHLQDMLDVGAISRCESPWASPVVLVRKKDGSLRFCIDLRKLNERTVKDAHPIPRIEESLDCLNGAKWFSSLDLKAGYWQVEMEESCKDMTAFTVGPLGHYRCERMPFGLTNAPATFKKLMEKCLGEYHLDWCLIYLDDVIVFSKTPEEHLERLQKVFKKLQEAGLKLKPSKCEFFKRRIKYLGHIVSDQGIEVDKSKIQDLGDWPIPRTVTDVKSFLGFTNYYRKFIKGYANMAKPINKLISGENARKKKARVPWPTECHTAFEALKAACMDTPVLAYADYTKPFNLYTDASDKGLGAVLAQVQEDGKERPIAYASRALSQSEGNYDAHKLEFLALKWSITDRFHEYLYGTGEPFHVFTDNNPLTYILTSAKLCAMTHRWVCTLAPYNFTLHYRSGKSNVNADALSRIPWDREIPKRVTQAIIDAKLNGPPGVAEVTSLPDAIMKADIPVNVNPLLSLEQWHQLQEEDPGIGPIWKWKTRQAVLPDTRELPHESRLLLKQRQLLVIRQGLLYRKHPSQGEQDTLFQLVLPYCKRELVLGSCHDDMGHPAKERTSALIKNRFFWPNMDQDIDFHCSNCERCLRFKARPVRAEMGTVTATYPLEIVHMDFLSIEHGVDTAKDLNILVVTDHFTRFAQAFVTANQQAKGVAQTLWDKYFMVYGIPERIISDQGRNFESELIQELCLVSGVKKLRTTPYHPQTNGQCERFNKTLIDMIGTLDPKLKRFWQQQIPTLTYSYNALRCSSTGFSPYFLMFGREPTLPIDILFGEVIWKVHFQPTKAYVKDLKSRLEWAFRKAVETQTKVTNQQKKYYDKRARAVALVAGDLVLVRQKHFVGKHKIRDKWENVVYQVVKRHSPTNSVYGVAPMDSIEDGPFRTLHRNMLYLLEVSSHQSESTRGSDGQEVPVPAVAKALTYREEANLMFSDDV